MAIFSWPDVAQTFWVARGLWYWSLSLAVWAFLTASQQNSMLDSLGHISSYEELRIAKQKIARLSQSGKLGFPHYVVLYFWQCPSMHMSYAWVSFFVALTIHVCRPMVPLIQRGEWTDDTRVSLPIYFSIWIVLTFYELGHDFLYNRFRRGRTQLYSLLQGFPGTSDVPEFDESVSDQHERRNECERFGRREVMKISLVGRAWHKHKHSEAAITGRFSLFFNSTVLVSLLLLSEVPAVYVHDGQKSCTAT